MEDIDSAGIGREQGPTAQPQPPADPLMPSQSSTALAGALPPAPPSSHDPFSRRKRNTVTLSGLLNAIDGNASQEGKETIVSQSCDIGTNSNQRSSSHHDLQQP
jgi:chaperone BCS1